VPARDLMNCSTLDGTRGRKNRRKTVALRQTAKILVPHIIEANAALLVIGMHRARVATSSRK
jgi:hypothetical protein